MKALDAAAPARFTWFNSVDITKPEAEAQLTQAVKDGAQGFGELKFHVAADGPELRRIYALAADLKVPVLVHFQEVDHFPGEGPWASGFAKTFESTEGTRIRAGTRAHYKTGGARLAIALDVPIVPVAHNAGYLWPKGVLGKRPGTITVSNCNPFALWSVMTLTCASAAPFGAAIRPSSVAQNAS